MTAALLLGVLSFPAIAAAESRAEQQTAAGLTAYWRLDFHGAEGHFQAAVEADPGSAAALYYLGYTVYKIAEPKRPNDPGKHRAALLFARAYEIDPSFNPGWGIRGRP